jgi:hypothetical protein
MDYKQAKGIRKQSFGSLLAEQEGGLGSSIKSAIGQKTKATMTGIKETFDPMNMARAIGGKTGAAMYGKAFGRDQKSMEHFAGAKSKKSLGDSSGGLDAGDSSSAADVLGLIYRLMMRSEEDKKTQRELEHNKLEEEEKEEDDRNKALIRALTGRKSPSRKQKKAERRAEKKAEKKEVPKTQTEKPTQKVSSKVETPSVTKPPSVSSAVRPTIPTAAKVVTGAAIVGAGGLLMPSESVASVINKASDTVGVDKSLMYAMAKQESGFDPSAGAKTSSAKGLYQFIKGTWKTMVEKYGSKYPILKERGPDDAEANAVAGALFIKENSEYLKKNGIPVNATTVYAAHFLGAGGAKTLLTADPNKLAAQLMPQAAQSNDFIFYEKTGNKPDKNKPRTVQQVIDVLFEKVGKYQEKYAQALNVPNVPGEQIDVASKKNKDLKYVAQNDIKPAQIQNTTNVTQTAGQPSTQQQSDDRNPYLKKVQG